MMEDMRLKSQEATTRPLKTQKLPTMVASPDGGSSLEPGGTAKLA